MTTITTSWSEISAFRQCPHKHWLGYVQRWKPDEEKETLARGTLFHSVMENHYWALFHLLKSQKAKGQARMDARAKYVEHMAAVSHLLGEKDPLQTPMQQLVEWMYRGYIEMYSTDVEEWEVVDVERKEVVPLPHPNGEESRFRLKVKIDLVARFRGKYLWIWDHKTCSNLPKGKELDLDDQIPLYAWTLRQSGVEIEGGVYNACLTRKNAKAPQPLDARFYRHMNVFGDEQLATIAAEAYWTAERMWPAAEDRTHLPERNPDPDTCRWKCDFTEPCLASRRGHSSEGLLQSYGFTQSLFRDAELEVAARPPLPKR